MESINSFAETVQYMKDQEIVYTIDHGMITYYYLSGENVVVKNPNAHYSVTFDDFKQLFSKLEFYLYKPTSDVVDEEKDKDYYAWKSKGTN